MNFDAKYYRRFYKKIAGKPKDIQLLMERTYGTSMAVLEELDGLSYPSILHDVFFFSNGLQIKAFSREFDGQLELAGGHPDEFVFHLHGFYNDLAARVRKHGLNREMADFIGGIMRHQYEVKGTISQGVINAYLSLAQQMIEYLRPNKYAFETYIYGVDTQTGEFLTGPCPYAYNDVPVIEMKHQIANGKPGQIPMFLDSKTGSVVSTEEQIQAMRVHSNTSAALLPLINEYNYDIVPTQTYSTIQLPLQGVAVSGDIEDLEEQLRRRRRTLPANGVRFTLNDRAGEVQGVLLKETMYQDTVHLLYRLDTKFGNLAGLYDTKTGFFYSALREGTLLQPYETLQILILSLYASYVLDTVSLSDIVILRGRRPIKVEEYSRGRVLQDVYHKGPSIRDPSLYEDKETAVGCYIRKLPAGMTASAEARALAAKHGYELKIGETFVQAFSKRVTVKKK